MWSSLPSVCFTIGRTELNGGNSSDHKGTWDDSRDLTSPTLHRQLNEHLIRLSDIALKINALLQSSIQLHIPHSGLIP